MTQELKHRVAIDDDESLDGPTLRAVPFEATSSPGETRLLSRRQRLQLARIATRIRLPQRMVLYREESIAHWVFFVADGVMKSFHDLPSGKRRIMAFLFADDVFGLAQHGHYVNTLQSVTPVTLYRIPLDVLTGTLRHDSDLQFQFILKLTHELREMQLQKIVFARRDAEGRLAMFLRSLERHASNHTTHSHIEIPMSRSDMANYLGLSLEAVSRASRKLELNGVLAFNDLHSVRVLNRSRFDKLATAL